MMSPTRIPATTSGRIGHHVGGASNPRPSGRSVKTHPCTRSTNDRKANAAAAIGTPMIAASTSRTTYLRLRSIA